MMRSPEAAPRSGSGRTSATSNRAPLPHQAPTRIAISYFQPYVGITRELVGTGRIVPTNSNTPGAPHLLLAEAKDTIAAGDRARALRLLDRLRYRPSDEGRQFPPAIADALVATARGDWVLA
jgi:hypothetical protein